MKTFNWQKYPHFTPAEMIETRFGHYYKSPVTGERYPSPTTILGKLTPFEKSEGYEKWVNKLGGGAEGKIIAKYISKLAMENGTGVHEKIEHYLRNKNVDVKTPLTVKAHFENIKPLLDNIDNIRECEIPLYSDSMKITGTSDCVAEYNGVLSIIDFKTSNTKKKEEWIENYFLQATAYAKMWEELTHEKIEQIVILITCSDDHIQEFVKKPSEYGGLLLQKLEEFQKMEVMAN